LNGGKGKDIVMASMQKTRGVIVTGASSGIGFECARWLAGHGFHVFAGIRRKPDAERLEKAVPGKITAVILDVTDAASIKSAVKAIGKCPADIVPFALVNNAGISIAGPLEMLPVDSFKRQIDVNLVGQLAVTQAFLPLLRAHHGRVFLMGSILGRFALPFLGAYSCAKFALEAMAESLSMELTGTGVSVSIIEPGNISTPIWEKSKATAMEIAGDLSDSKWDMYRDDARAALGYVERLSEKGLQPARVAQVIEKALNAREAKKKYTVGPDSAFLGKLLPVFPAGLRQAILRRVVLRR
jgi:NAD(P)-dependent dehydrogenase (short-subunit alcohol dehydrogenase family)